MRRRTWLFVGWLAIVSLLATGKAEQSLGADETAKLRVMSFNIRFGTAKDGENAWEHRRERVVETIRKFNPDLLGTQETLGFQKEYLEGALPDYTAFGAGRDDGGQTGEMTALFYRTTRFERLDGGHFWLSLTPDLPGSKSWDSSLPRIASWVRLRDKQGPAGSELWFLNTHFDHRGAEARLKSAELIRQWAADRQGPLIVTGDFNAAEGSAPYRALFRGAAEQETGRVLTDTFRRRHPERLPLEGTFNGFQPDNRSGGRIDWIAVSPELGVLEADIVTTSWDGRTASDHFAVTAVLRVGNRE